MISAAAPPRSAVGRGSMRAIATLLFGSLLTACSPNVLRRDQLLGIEQAASATRDLASQGAS